MKKYISKFKYIALATVFSLSIISCEKDEPAPVEGELASETGTVSDAEGNVYKTAKIGNQWWMTENLRSSVFCPNVNSPAPNDTIQALVGATVWNGATSPAWINYQNDTELGNTYGKLYNGWTVITGRNICPCGWRIPNEDDWLELSLFLDSDRSYDGTNSAGGKLKSLDITTWEQPNVGATNESGFNALPSGMRLINVDVPTNVFSQYQGLGRVASFWIKSPVSPQQPLVKKAVLTTGSASLSISNEARLSGLAIRCIKE